MRTTAMSQPRRALPGTSVPVVRDATIVFAAAAAAGALAATVVLVFDVGEPVRDWYGLTPENPAQVGVGELWLHNARVLLVAFAAAAAVTWWPGARRVIDVVLIAVFAVNVLVVAVALGAYGEALWRLGPGHYPLELLAVAIAAAAYLDARRCHRLRPPIMAACIVAAGMVLLIAAALESAGAR